MWGGHSWVRLLNYVHLRWNSSHLPYWTGGRLENLFKEVSWNSVRKMNGKIVCAALHYLCTGSVPYFPMFKETNKEGKWRKKRHKSFLPLMGKNKERSSIKIHQETMKIRPGVWFWPLLLWHKQIKSDWKIRRSDFRALLLHKQDLAWSLLCINAFSLCVHQNESLLPGSYWASGRNVPPKGENRITGFTAQGPEQPARDGDELKRGTWH